MDIIWTFDKEAELQIAWEQNHFTRPTKDSVFLSGDAVESRQGFEYHLERCKNLILLCEILDIKVSGLAVYGSVPVVFVDVIPSVKKGYHPNKYSRIIEHNSPNRFECQFNPSRWTTPLGIETEKIFAEWIIRI